MKLSWWKSSKFDLTGKVFGRLVVVKQIPKQGARRWMCRCSCGNITEVAASNLKRGLVISCGCALKGCNKKRPYEWIYNRLKANGRHEVELTYEDFCSFTKTTECHYCGRPVIWDEHANWQKTKHGGSNLDRKDNSAGYIKGNVVVCCPSCNRTKGDRFTYEQFLKIAAVIRSFG